MNKVFLYRILLIILTYCFSRQVAAQDFPAVTVKVLHYAVQKGQPSSVPRLERRAWDSRIKMYFDGQQLFNERKYDWSRRSFQTVVDSVSNAITRQKPSTIRVRIEPEPGGGGGAYHVDEYLDFSLEPAFEEYEVEIVITTHPFLDFYTFIKVQWHFPEPRIQKIETQNPSITRTDDNNCEEQVVFKTPHVFDPSWGIDFHWYVSKDQFNWSNIPGLPIINTVDSVFYTPSISSDGLGDSIRHYKLEYHADGLIKTSIIQSHSVYPAPPSYVPYDTTDITCFGFANGTIDIDEANIIGGYRGPSGTDDLVTAISLIDPKDTNNPFGFNYGSGVMRYGNLTPGDYKLRVVNADRQCIAEDIDFSITQPDPLTFNAAKTDIACFGDDDGSITVTATGGNGGYEFSQDNGSNYVTGNQSASQHEFKPLDGGIYIVKITDSNNCPADTSHVTIHEPAVLSATFSSGQVECNGQGNGSILLETSGGTAPYQFSKDNGTTFVNSNNFSEPHKHSFSLLDGGDYEIIVKDANGCEWTQTIAVYEPELLSFSLTTQDISCFGLSDGKITVHAMGGNGGYEYRTTVSPYLSFDNDSVFTNLNLGSYTVFLKDVEGCTANQIGITLTQPDELKIDSLSSTNISCYDSADGSITVNTTGGNGGNSYYWRDENNLSTTFTTSTTTTNNLLPTTYGVYVVDSKGCQTPRSTKEITEPTELSANPIITDATCYGADDGSLNLSNSQISGGTSPYQVWSSGFVTSGFESPNTFTGIAAGNYFWSVKDANGCLVNYQSYTINEPDELTLSHTKSPASCFGENDASITLSSAGGNGSNSYAYKASSESNYTLLPDTNISSLVASNYDLKVTDGKGCVAEQSTTLTQPDSLKITTIDITDILCGEIPTGKIALTTSGGNSGTVYSWNDYPDSTRNTLTNLRGGSYTFNVTDSKSCPSYGIKTATIAEPDPIVATANPTDISCHSADDGAIALSVTSGGTAPFTYSLQGYATNSSQTNYTNLAASSYNWSVEDANGCLYNEQVILSQPDSLQLQITQIDSITCAGNNNGAITVTAQGGNGNTTYAFNDFNYQADSAFANLTAAVYKIRLQDSKGCQDSLDYNLTEPDSLKITNITATDILCGGYPTGSIQLITEGGNTNTSYSWTDYPDSSRNELTNLRRGTYTFEVTDNKNCPSYGTKSITLAEPDSLEATSLFENISCNNASNGQISIQAVGGITPYEYSLNASTFDSDSLFTDLDSNTYNWIVRDQNGCEVNNQNPIILSQPDSLILSLDNYDSITCYNSQNGSLQLAATGGTAPYSYALNSINYVQDFINYNNLDTGSYVLRLQDQNGCLDSLTTTFTQPDSLQIDSIVTTDLLCGEEQNGALLAYASGGNQGNTYSWRQYPDSNTSYLQNLNGGNYHLVVTDRKGCETDTATAFVYEPPKMQVSTAPEDAKCNGEADGTILLDVTGGTAPFTYSIDNGATFENDSLFENQALGTYNWVIQDNNNCQETGIVEINEPTPLIASLFSNDSTLCFGSMDGSITLSIQGGTKPYSYSTDAINYQSDSVLYGLGAGNYDVYIKDRFNCFDTIQTTIGQPTEITASFENQWVVCKGNSTGQSAVSIQGGSPSYVLLWSNNDTDTLLNDVPAGDYNITVLDDHNCNKQFQTTIKEPTQAFELQFTSVSNASCDELTDGSITASLTGGAGQYSYQWNDLASASSSLQLTDLPYGRYYRLEASDSLGCNLVDSVYINYETPFAVQDIFRDTVVICADEFFVTDQTQANVANYQWTYNGSNYSTDPDLTLFLLGDYSITLSDNQGCIDQKSFVLKDSPDKIEPLFAASTQNVFGDTLILTEISWPVPDQVIWNFGSATVLDNNEINPMIYFPSDEDSVEVVLTAKVGSCEKSYSKTIYFYPEDSITSTISRLGFRGITDVSLYPNPSNGRFHTKVELTHQENIRFEIVNDRGDQLLVRESQELKTHRESFDIQGIPSGLYFLRIIHPDDAKILRFIIY